jgi:hypothetical protein
MKHGTPRSGGKYSLAGSAKAVVLLFDKKIEREERYLGKLGGRAAVRPSSLPHDLCTSGSNDLEIVKSVAMAVLEPGLLILIAKPNLYRFGIDLGISFLHPARPQPTHPTKNMKRQRSTKCVEPKYENRRII